MNTAEFLRSKGIQPSQQRIRIYETLAATKAHPSAEAIHAGLVPEFATLSRTTVYNTLDLFADKGIARRLTLSGTEFRWDADLSSHAHFHCRRCGAVVDLAARRLPGGLPLPEGFLAERLQVSVEGLCASCRGPAGGPEANQTA